MKAESKMDKTAINVIKFSGINTLKFHYYYYNCSNNGGRRNQLVVKAGKGKEENRKQLQKGRNLSTEAIQAVQSLKRAFNNSNNNSFQSVFDSKFSRLLKLDKLASLRELLRQNQCILALKVFEDIRNEYWYKPKLLLYDEMIKVMASNGNFDFVQILFLYLKSDIDLLEEEIDSFNVLYITLTTFNLIGLAVDLYALMKSIKCEPDRSTFKILICFFESIGESTVSGVLRQDAQKIYGESLEFLDEEETEDGVTPVRRSY